MMGRQSDTAEQETTQRAEICAWGDRPYDRASGKEGGDGTGMALETGGAMGWGEEWSDAGEGRNVVARGRAAE